jgi:phenylacetate-CoA ligase
MIYDWKMELYWRLPVTVQEAILSRYAMRLDRTYYGTGYQELEMQYRGRRGWSRERAQEWLTQECRTLLQAAGTKVPFYRREWRHLDWQSIVSPSDLPLLPLLNRQDLRLNESAFLVEGAARDQLWAERTSGTTGTSVTVYWHPDGIKKWWAIYEVFCRELAGVGRYMPRAMVGGRPIVAGATRTPPFWRFNKRWGQLYLSAYHISHATASEYVQALRQYQPSWITGYGSAWLAAWLPFP